MILKNLVKTSKRILHYQLSYPKINFKRNLDSFVSLANKKNLLLLLTLSFIMPKVVSSPDVLDLSSSIASS